MPSGPKIVLCAPELGMIFVITSPVVASITFQCGPSSDGTYIVCPSGESDIRSQPPS